MTPNEINKKIAEFCGWYRIEHSGVLLADPPYKGYPPRNTIIGEKYQIPDYYNDLNVLHEEEIKLRVDEKETYIDHLTVIVEQQKHETLIEHIEFASSQQRAQAFIRTIETYETQNS
jgi:hypothetical protein